MNGTDTVDFLGYLSYLKDKVLSIHNIDESIGLTRH